MKNWTMNIKSWIKDSMAKFKSKYREMKDSIPKKTGNVMCIISMYIMTIGFFLFMPIIFTLLSTLMGSGLIAKIVYDVVFYTTWVVILISLLVWAFFKEYKTNKQAKK